MIGAASWRHISNAPSWRSKVPVQNQSNGRRLKLDTWYECLNISSDSDLSAPTVRDVNLLINGPWINHGLPNTCIDAISMDIFFFFCTDPFFHHGCSSSCTGWPNTYTIYQLCPLGRGSKYESWLPNLVPNQPISENNKIYKFTLSNHIDIRWKWVYQKPGQWIASLSTHHLSYAQASFPTSHTVLSCEGNLVC
jgi:hypothetical protein